MQIRNQLNQEQNSKLQQQKELLNKRNMEVAMMDKRISELRERLYGKKIQLNRVNGTSSPQSPLSTSGRVAAVGPYIQVPSTGGFPLPGDPVKPQSLTIASSAAHGRSKSGHRDWQRATSHTWCGQATAPKLWDISKFWALGPGINKLSGEEERRKLAQTWCRPTESAETCPAAPSKQRSPAWLLTADSAEDLSATKSHIPASGATCLSNWRWKT